MDKQNNWSRDGEEMEPLTFCESLELIMTIVSSYILVVCLILLGIVVINWLVVGG